MAKHNRKQEAVEVEQVVETTESLQQPEENTEQAVRSEPNFAKSTDDLTASEEMLMEQDNKQPLEEQALAKQKKSGGTAIALLALLIALGIGGAGYLLGQQKFSLLEKQLADSQQQLNTLSQQLHQVKAPNFDNEKAQLVKLNQSTQQALQQIQQLSHQQANEAQQIKGLQLHLEKLGSTPKTDTSAWLLSDADFLLTNALRKVVIDNDLDTAKSLLLEADKALSQIDDNELLAVREAIKADLNLLSSLNQVDQNSVMQRLAQLANLLDDMPMLDNDEVANRDNGEISDSIADWQKNIEKSANSFLSHFIRISDKNKADEKAFIAPNQEIYLRENIRLRLQLAILAVPRQQNELYKQSLDAVSSWLRSYFDVQNKVVQKALKELDELVEQSIYIDAPNQLQSLALLKQKLNRRDAKVDKIQLDVDKAVEQLTAEDPKATPNNEQEQRPTQVEQQ